MPSNGSLKDNDIPVEQRDVALLKLQYNFLSHITQHKEQYSELPPTKLITKLQQCRFSDKEIEAISSAYISSNMEASLEELTKNIGDMAVKKTAQSQVQEILDSTHLLSEHIAIIKETTLSTGVIVAIRPVNELSSKLLADKTKDYICKPMSIKGKSSSFGILNGSVPTDQSISKLASSGDQNAIEKFSGKNQDALLKTAATKEILDVAKEYNSLLSKTGEIDSEQAKVLNNRLRDIGDKFLEKLHKTGSHDELMIREFTKLSRLKLTIEDDFSKDFISDKLREVMSNFETPLEKKGDLLSFNQFLPASIELKSQDIPPLQILFIKDKDGLAVKDDNGQPIFLVKDDGFYYKLQGSQEEGWTKGELYESLVKEPVNVEIMGLQSHQLDGTSLKDSPARPVTADLDLFALFSHKDIVLANDSEATLIGEHQKDKQSRSELRKALSEQKASGAGFANELGHVMGAVFRADTSDSLAITHGAEVANPDPEIIDGSHVFSIPDKNGQESLLIVLETEGQILDFYNQMVQMGYNAPINKNWGWSKGNDGQYFVSEDRIFYQKLGNNLEQLKKDLSDQYNIKDGFQQKEDDDLLTKTNKRRCNDQITAASDIIDLVKEQNLAKSQGRLEEAEKLGEQILSLEKDYSKNYSKISKDNTEGKEVITLAQSPAAIALKQSQDQQKKFQEKEVEVFKKNWHKYSDKLLNEINNNLVIETTEALLAISKEEFVKIFKQFKNGEQNCEYTRLKEKMSDKGQSLDTQLGQYSGALEIAKLKLNIEQSKINNHGKPNKSLQEIIIQKQIKYQDKYGETVPIHPAISSIVQFSREATISAKTQELPSDMPKSIQDIVNQHKMQSKKIKTEQPKQIQNHKTASKTELEPEEKSSHKVHQKQHVEDPQRQEVETKKIGAKGSYNQNTHFEDIMKGEMKEDPSFIQKIMNARKNIAGEKDLSDIKTGGMKQSFSEKFKKGETRQV